MSPTRKLADLCRGELNEFHSLLLRPRNTFASETRRGGGGGDCVHGRLISKAIVCKSGGNFVTATISVIKRASLSLASFALSLSLFSLSLSRHGNSGGCSEKLFEISKH